MTRAYVEVEVDLNDFDTQDIIEHLEYKGYTVFEESELEREIHAASPFIGEMHELYELKTLGKEKEFEEAFRKLCYTSTGTIL